MKWWLLLLSYGDDKMMMSGLERVLSVSVDTKKEEEEEEVVDEVKKRVPLSLEELLAKKKAEEAAQSKVWGMLLTTLQMI